MGPIPHSERVPIIDVIAGSTFSPVSLATLLCYRPRNSGRTLGEKACSDFG